MSSEEKDKKTSTEVKMHGFFNNKKLNKKSKEKILHCIVYKCQDTEQKTTIRRLITVYENQAFYCSSGVNSGNKDTWFPLCFILAKTPKYKSKSVHVGDLIKPIGENAAYFQRNFPELTTSGSNQSEQIILQPERFANEEFLCYSAELGGGFWLTTAGAALKKRLEYKSPEFIMIIDGVTADPEIINLWLVANGHTIDADSIDYALPNFTTTEVAQKQ